MGPKQRGLLMTKRAVTPPRPRVVRVTTAPAQTRSNRDFLPPSRFFLKTFTSAFKLLRSKNLLSLLVTRSWGSGTRKIAPRTEAIWHASMSHVGAINPNSWIHRPLVNWLRTPPMKTSIWMIAVDKSGKLPYSFFLFPYVRNIKFWFNRSLVQLRFLYRYKSARQKILAYGDCARITGRSQNRAVPPKRHHNTLFGSRRTKIKIAFASSNALLENSVFNSTRKGIFCSKRHNHYLTWRTAIKKSVAEHGRPLFDPKLKAWRHEMLHTFSRFTIWYGFWNGKSRFVSIQCCLQWEMLPSFNAFPVNIHLTSGEYSFSRWILIGQFKFQAHQPYARMSLLNSNNIMNLYCAGCMNIRAPAHYKSEL